jgi:hypothetical protein
MHSSLYVAVSIPAFPPPRSVALSITFWSLRVMMNQLPAFGTCCITESGGAVVPFGPGLARKVWKW